MPPVFRISRQFVEISIQPLRGMLRFVAAPMHRAGGKGESPSFTINFDGIVALETLAARCLNGRDEVGDATEIDPIRGRGGLLKLYMKGKRPCLRLAFHECNKEGAGGPCPQCGQGRLIADRDSIKCPSCEYTPGRFRISSLLPSELNRLQAACVHAKLRQAIFDELAGNVSSKGKDQARGQPLPSKQKEQPAREKTVRGGEVRVGRRPTQQVPEGKPPAPEDPPGKRQPPEQHERSRTPQTGRLVLPDDEVILL